MRTEHRRLPWLAGAFLAAVLIAAVVILIAYGGHRGDTQARTSKHHPSASARPSGGHCPTDTTGTPSASSPPPGITWAAVPDHVTVQVPDGGDRYGPCHATHTVATGYAHTPAGALVAATQIFTRSSMPGQTGRQTIRQQVVDGPSKQTLLDAVPTTPTASTDQPAIAAYAINSYTSTAAQISLAMSYNSIATYLVVQLNVQWHGDWQLVAPTGGDWSSAITQMVTLEGFTSWGPR